jgi:hypothetical protein
MFSFLNINFYKTQFDELVMKNILSIKYFRELNQNSIVDELSIGRQFPSLEKMTQEFTNSVESVESKNSDDGIHIGISFTNTNAHLIHVSGKHHVRKNCSLMFWPVYGEVDYKFKKKDFFVNEGRDPRILTFSRGWFESSNNFSKLFFTKNPYENPNCYKKISCFLPDLYGNQSLNIWRYF